MRWQTLGKRQYEGLISRAFASRLPLHSFTTASHDTRPEYNCQMPSVSMQVPLAGIQLVRVTCNAG